MRASVDRHLAPWSERRIETRKPRRRQQLRVEKVITIEFYAQFEHLLGTLLELKTGEINKFRNIKIMTICCCLEVANRIKFRFVGENFIQICLSRVFAPTENENKQAGKLLRCIISCHKLTLFHAAFVFE
jgi:hypothetical protein